jgi:CelD/BcsL family acetyltransferase involved in cellulose biosynthesis
MVGAVIDLFSGEADAVHFQRQPEEINGFANPFARYNSVAYSARSHQTRLAGSFDAYYRSKRNSSSRRHDRLKWEKLGAAADTAIVDATTPAEIDAILAALFSQKRASLAARGVPDLFAKPGVRDFYRALAAKPWPEGPTHVSAIRHGDEYVATNWGLIRGNHYYYVMTSYSAGPSSAHSPGRALMYHLMDWSIAQGIEIFDFTIGDEDFKDHWCELSATVYDSIALLRPRGAGAVAALRSLKGAKRFIKQRPRLSRLIGRVRRRIPVA